MRGVLTSLGKVLAFLGVWAVLISIVVMTAIFGGGRDWFASTVWRLGVEIGGTIAVLAALVFMAFVVDKRGAETLGFSAARLWDLLLGAVIGALLLAPPLVVLFAAGAMRYAPELAGFTPHALALGLTLCFFNVVTQEVLVRSYIFQELWKKYGAAIAIAVTTALFVALHAAVLTQGAQGLIAAANVALAGVMLGLAYVRSGALWLPIGLHLGWNALQGPVLNINVTGADLAFGAWRIFEFTGDPMLTGGDMGVEGGLAGLIGPALGILLLAFVWPKRR